MKRLSLAGLTIGRVFIGWLEEKNNHQSGDKVTVTTCYLGKIAVTLERGSSMRFHFKLRTNIWNYLEITDVEGRSFYGT